MVLIIAKLDSASAHESIASMKKAGLLTCNIAAVLPIPVNRDSGHQRAATEKLLTVAGQLVIFTRFPINLRMQNLIQLEERKERFMAANVVLLL